MQLVERCTETLQAQNYSSGVAGHPSLIASDSPGANHSSATQPSYDQLQREESNNFTRMTSLSVFHGGDGYFISKSRPSDAIISTFIAYLSLLFYDDYIFMPGWDEYLARYIWLFVVNILIYICLWYADFSWFCYALEGPMLHWNKAKELGWHPKNLIFLMIFHTLHIIGCLRRMSIFRMLYADLDL